MMKETWVIMQGKIERSIDKDECEKELYLSTDIDQVEIVLCEFRTERIRYATFSRVRCVCIGEEKMPQTKRPPYRE